MSTGGPKRLKQASESKYALQASSGSEEDLDIPVYDADAVTILSAAVWPQLRSMLTTVTLQQQYSSHDALGAWLLSQDSVFLRRPVDACSEKLQNIWRKAEGKDVKWFAAAALVIQSQMSEQSSKRIFATLSDRPWFMTPFSEQKLFRTLAKNEANQETRKTLPATTTVSLSKLLGLPSSKSRDVDERVKSFPLSTQKNLLDIVTQMAVSSSSSPVLVRGAPGSGKTWSIRTLATLFEKELLELQLDDQVDSKVLLGSLTSVRGSFEWVPGALTQAIHSGQWVLIEDVDKCPNEILAALKPLFENGRLSIPNRSSCYDLVCHSSFRLFATSSNKDFFLHKESEIVDIGPLTLEELTLVCVNRYGHRIPAFVIEDIVRCSSELSQNTDAGASIRDLIKWLDRVGIFHGELVAQIQNRFLTEAQKKDIVIEGLDVLASRLIASTGRVLLARRMATWWGLSPDVGNDVILSRRAEIGFETEVRTWHIGRASLRFQGAGVPRDYTDSFAPTSVALRTLEQVAVCISLNEPCLLVGETGAGKTSAIQLLAKCCGKTLVVQNMHVQSDSAEFLGGFKPTTSLRTEASTLHAEFRRLFCENFDETENEKFLGAVAEYLENDVWKKFCKALEAACSKYWAKMKATGIDSQDKRFKGQHDDAWLAFGIEVESFKAKMKSKDLFTFVEGALIKALRNGDWILLDEVNLASSETLERLLPLMEDSTSSLRLTERGDIAEIPRHPDFRLLAAMNPSSDFGKKDLPWAVRSRFTEIYVEEVTEAADVRLVVDRFLGQDARDLVEPVVATYLRARELASAAGVLVDGNGQSPRYSLRTLVRALQAARSLSTSQRFGMKRALIESFLALFATSLEAKSAILLEQEIASKILGPGERLPKGGSKLSSGDAAKKVLVCDGAFWVDRGEEEVAGGEDRFVSTPHVDAKLKVLARAVAMKRYPILIQGPTSAGKTSLVFHLGKLSGNRVVRINNHEHTDLEEYLGGYVANDEGKLAFHYGVLVDAVRNGHWVILDELNLAPSDVLEALNRLLDDNRELFLTETQETILPHPNFVLFATQNPPGGAYGGRKQLSRAFRNRFLEIHVDDIPTAELETIIERRNSLPPSFAKAMVATMKELQLVRSKSHLFAGKAGYITPRDLMRWADRDPRSYDELAQHGYRLLAERLRSAEEREEVRLVVEKFCRAQIKLDELYCVPAGMEMDFVWTQSMRRLFSLVMSCAEKREPCLIVGETGLGKTRCVQAVAKALNNELVVLNCHQNTETADILGSLRPARNRAEASQRLRELLRETGSASVDMLEADPAVSMTTKQEARRLVAEGNKMFEWADGPLVECMRSGKFFLLDEISLAEDAVLERLNSVLEPGRTLTLAERGGLHVEVIKAQDGFRAFATMNPGGDFGKRELSPALRNRFTEIWLPGTLDFDDFRLVAEDVLRGLPGGFEAAKAMVGFVRWFNQPGKGKGASNLSPPLSMRDVIAWAEFIKATVTANKEQSDANGFTMEMLAHGCFLTCLDGLGVGAGAGSAEIKQEFMVQCRKSFPAFFASEERMLTTSLVDTQQVFGVDKFLVTKVSHSESSYGADKFDFDAPTTRLNLVRLLRALQLKRAVLLEGSPGVGKTSIVAALARKLNRRLARINLSEQTDFSDLVGSDLPVPSTTSGNEDGSERMEFQWSDGEFLQALQRGDWVLLDELNLASQSVLEGLNAVLDHRATVFIPELNKSFACHPDFRVFGCQNPLQQGGGRKGLPRSFLNRFTKVYVEPLVDADFLSIARKVFPDVSHLDSVINLTKAMNELAQGRAEFNLRDAFRFCEMLRIEPDPHMVFNLLYSSRFGIDAVASQNAFEAAFGTSVSPEEFAWSSVAAHNSLVMFGSKRHSVKQRETVLIDAPSGLSSFPTTLYPILTKVGICVSRDFPVLLMGPSGSGKSLVLNRLAGLCGRDLKIFQMTSATDATELLGCFEQIEPRQRALEMMRGLELVLVANAQAITSAVMWSPERLDRLSQVSDALDSLRSAAQAVLAGSAAFPFAAAEETFRAGLNALLTDNEIPADARSDVIKHSLDSTREKLESEWNAWKEATTRNAPRGFRWVDGVLVDAVENGLWLVLEDANLCAPSVLDRLNSLLESEGALVLNEQGAVAGGGSRVVRRHPEFRVFLTVDPSKGMISRAMRNRCVEIFIDPLKYAPSKRDRIVALEEQYGIRPDIFTGSLNTAKAERGFVIEAKRIKRRAQLGLLVRSQVLLAPWSLPYPLSWRGDIGRDTLVANIRLLARLMNLISAMSKDQLDQDVMSFLLGSDSHSLVLPTDPSLGFSNQIGLAFEGGGLADEVQLVSERESLGKSFADYLLCGEAKVDLATPLTSFIVSVLQRFKSSDAAAKEWVERELGSLPITENKLGEVLATCLSRLGQSSLSFVLRTNLEKLFKGDASVIQGGNRYLEPMIGALDDWLETFGSKGGLIPFELENLRGSMWRMFMAPDLAIIPGDALSIVFKRLMKQVKQLRDNNHAISSSAESTRAWTHFENVARRFDSTLKRPCFDRVFSPDSKIDSRNSKQTFLKLIGKGRPPTDHAAFEGAQRLIHMALKEYDWQQIDPQHMESNGKDEDADEAPRAVVIADTSKRGEAWRRRLISALATMRFVGGGGGIGPSSSRLHEDVSIYTDLPTLRDSALAACRDDLVVADSVNFTDILPLAERVLALCDLRVADLIAKLATDGATDQGLLEDAREAVRVSIDLAVAANARPANLLLPHQEFLWATSAGTKVDPHQVATALLPEFIVASRDACFMGRARAFPFEGKRKFQLVDIKSLLWQNSTTLLLSAVIRGSGLGLDALATLPDHAACVQVKRPVALNERETKGRELGLAMRCLETPMINHSGFLDAEIQAASRIVVSTLAAMDDSALPIEVSQRLGTSLSSTRSSLDSIMSSSSSLSATGDWISSETIGCIGRAFALAGVARYSGAIMELDVDPQSKPRVIMSLLAQESRMVSRDLDALKLNGLWSNGTTRSIETSRLGERLEHLHRAMDELGKNGISIERDTEFDRFTADLRSFIKTIGAPSRILGMLESLDKGRDVKDANNFIDVCASFCLRLRSQFPACVELATSVVGALYTTIHGLELSVVGASQTNSREATELLRQLHAWPRVDRRARKFESRLLGPKFNTKLLLASLSQTELHKTEFQEPTLALNDHSRLREAFETVTHRWREDKREEDRRRAESEALVKLKSASKKDEETETPISDLKAEVEFKQMFPDFHAEFATKHQTDDEEGDVPMGDEEANIKFASVRELEQQEQSIAQFQALNKDQVSTMVQSFISLYTTSKAPSANSVELRRRAFVTAYDVVVDLVSQVSIVGPPSADESVLASSKYLLRTCLDDFKF